MNLEINKKAVEESSRKFMEKMQQDQTIYGSRHIINKVQPSDSVKDILNLLSKDITTTKPLMENGGRPSNIMTEEVPYFIGQGDQEVIDKLSEMMTNIHRKDVPCMEFITGTPSTEPSQNYEWRLEQPTVKEILDSFKEVNPLVNKEINYCGTCGSVLENNKCNCSSKPVQTGVKEVKNEIIYTPNKLEEKVNYYTPDKKEESIQYVATTDIVTTNNPVTVYTLDNSTELQELFDYCKEEELTISIDFGSNKIVIDDTTFISDSIEKSIKMALSFIK